MSSASHNSRDRTGARCVPDFPAYDLLVVGSGIAGLSAATSAAESGLDVLLEKTERIDGSSAMSGGGSAFTGTDEQAEEDIATPSRRSSKTCSRPVGTATTGLSLRPPCTTSNGNRLGAGPHATREKDLLTRRSRLLTWERQDR